MRPFSLVINRVKHILRRHYFYFYPEKLQIFLFDPFILVGIEKKPLNLTDYLIQAWLDNNEEQVWHLII